MGRDRSDRDANELRSRGRWSGILLGVSHLGSTLADTAAPAPVAKSGVFTSLAGWFNGACTLDASGVARCWGQNTRGTVGDGSESSQSTPVPVGAAVSFVELAAGPSHVCGLTTAGAAYCWGSNEKGQTGVAPLGDGSTEDSATPVRVRDPES